MAKQFPKFAPLWHPEALSDLLALSDISHEISDAAQEALDDLVYGRKTGKALGDRETSGDLTGLYRLKFDLEDVHPQRYRVLFEVTADSELVIWAIGERQTRKVYRDTHARRSSRDVSGHS